MNRTVAMPLILGLCLAAGAANADERRYQTSNVIDVSGAGQPYPGAAWLIRSEDGIQGRIMTNVSTAGDPYTLWVVIFNNPAACIDGCDASDLAIAEVGGSVFNGTGAISVPNGSLHTNGKPAPGGVLNMDFQVAADALPTGLFLLVGDPAGLHAGNGFGAEVHLVVDKHPPISPGMSWIVDLTETNFPGGGPATNEVVAVFLACPDAAGCPGSVL